MDRSLFRSVGRVAAALVLLGAPGIAPVVAQIPTEQVIVLSATSDPVESPTFDISVANDYDVTVRDLGAISNPTNGALRSLRVALMRGATIVATFTQPGMRAVALTPGTYQLRAVGEPSPDPDSGPFSVVIAPPAGGPAVIQYVDSLSRPPPLVPSNVSFVAAEFRVTDAGSHQITVTDLAFPQALTSAEVLIVSRTATPLVAETLSLPGSPPATTATKTLTLPADTYDVFAIGDSSTAVNAGLLRVVVRAAATSSTIFSLPLTVGRVSQRVAIALEPGDHQLRLVDLAFPAALASSRALILRGASTVARLNAAGTTPFTVSENGLHELFVLAVPGASPSAGSAAVAIERQSAPLFEDVVVAGGDEATGTPIYAYTVDVSAAGSHALVLRDFQFPSSLVAIGSAVVQRAAVVASTTVAGTVDAVLASGRAFVILLARPASAAGGSLTGSAGLAGVELRAAGASTPLLETSQGVGGLFDARRVTITATRDYRFTISDLDFPATLAEVAVAITRGNTLVGSIFGEGSFDVVAAPAGNYFVNFIARPNATERAGFLAIAVGDKPPNPTISLTAEPRRVPSGGTTRLTWTAQDATACTASGAWSGARATSGTENTAAITLPTTYTLTCTGSGGSTTASLTVELSEPTGGGGGGGSFDAWSLAVLAWLLACVLVARCPDRACRPATASATIAHRRTTIGSRYASDALLGGHHLRPRPDPRHLSDAES